MTKAGKSTTAFHTPLWESTMPEVDIVPEVRNTVTRERPRASS
jgi:hypothetical protein